MRKTYDEGFAQSRKYKIAVSERYKFNFVERVLRTETSKTAVDNFDRVVGIFFKLAFMIFHDVATWKFIITCKISENYIVFTF